VEESNRVVGGAAITGTTIPSQQIVAALSWGKPVNEELRFMGNS
jgi:uncharacterized protein (DUF433 family)